MQPLLSSAGRQYGISSLDSDAFELDELAQHLKSFYNSKVRTLAAWLAELYHCSLHSRARSESIRKVRVEARFLLMRVGL